MDDCIFCKIIKKEIPAHIVYEDGEVIAFLDISPINPGHILVLPKVHVPDFYDLEEGVYGHVMAVVQKLGKVVHEKIKPLKVGTCIIGLDVPHTHVHIIPIHQYHDITSKAILDGTRGTPSKEELETMANLLEISNQ